MSIIMKIAGDLKIQGESLVEGFKDAIDLLNIDHDITLPMLKDKTSNARATNKPIHSDFVVRMRLNKSYPLLLKAVANAQSLGNVTVHFTKVQDGKNVEVLVYTMTDAFISKVDIVPENEGSQVTQSSSDSTVPIVEFAVNYQSIQSEYKTNSLKGGVTGQVSSGMLTGMGA